MYPLRQASHTHALSRLRARGSRAITPARAKPEIIPDVSSPFLSARWWADLPIARKLDVYVALVLLLTLVLILLTSLTVAELNRSSAQRLRAQARLANLNSLEKALLNIETGERGYLLSQKENFLEPYLEGRRVLSELLPKLEADPEAPPAFHALAAAIRSYLNEWAELNIARVRSQGPFSEAQQLRVFEEGKARFDLLRQQFAKVQNQLAEQFTQSRMQNLREIGQLRSLVWVALGVLVGSTLLLRLGTQRAVIEPLQRLRESTSRLGGGDYSARVSIQRRDELGQLAQAFNLAAANLERSNQSLVEANRHLQEQQAELERSNRELEQFAYVASHDLQEPLRMVSSYTQLLERRYKGKLDEKADMYIHFAVDGANRMQQLIQDLLVYSRVGTKGMPFQAVDTARVVAETLRDLEVAIAESGAQVQLGTLPIVWGDPSQIRQVFQNLLSNALKFRREGVQPRLEIGAQREGGGWRFRVADNGIGIESPYFDRIFLIFQRLHTKEAYPGNGIGLAVVKKIIERHGGKLWLESTPGEGSTFFFTLPEAPVERA